MLKAWEVFICHILYALCGRSSKRINQSLGDNCSDKEKNELTALFEEVNINYPIVITLFLIIIIILFPVWHYTKSLSSFAVNIITGGICLFFFASVYRIWFKGKWKDYFMEFEKMQNSEKKKWHFITIGFFLLCCLVFFVESKIF